MAPQQQLVVNFANGGGGGGGRRRNSGKGGGGGPKDGNVRKQRHEKRQKQKPEKTNVIGPPAKCRTQHLKDQIQELRLAKQKADAESEKLEAERIVLQKQLEVAAVRVRLQTMEVAEGVTASKKLPTESADAAAEAAGAH